MDGWLSESVSESASKCVTSEVMSESDRTGRSASQ